MDIEYINDLHFSQRCRDEKIHVTPHICILYFPLICDIRYFVFVLFEKQHNPLHGRCVHGEYFGLPLMIEKLWKFRI